MIKLQRIFCPTDFSTESDEALRYAVALSRAYEAKLVLLHCSQQRLAENQAQMDRMFTESLAPHLGLAELREVDWEGVVVRTDQIGKAIVDEASKRQVDLIVMRSRRRGRAAVLLGSTAEMVSELAPCPVLVTHPLEREWVGKTTGEIDLHRILVATDFSRDSQLALTYGASLAQEYQAEVHVLTVLANGAHEKPELAWSTSSEGSAYKFAAQRLQQSIPKEVFLWCRVISVVRAGKVPQEVLAYATEKEIDLICMGASGDNSPLSRVLGSNVDRVLREAPCPVLIARSLSASASA